MGEGLTSQPFQRQRDQAAVEPAVRECVLHLSEEWPRDAEVENAEGDVDPVRTPEELGERVRFTRARDLVVLADHPRDLGGPFGEPLFLQVSGGAGDGGLEVVEDPIRPDARVVEVARDGELALGFLPLRTRRPCEMGHALGVVPIAIQVGTEHVRRGAEELLELRDGPDGQRLVQSISADSTRSESCWRWSTTT